MTPIPETHPIREMFECIVNRVLAEEVSLRDPRVCRYLTQILVEFSHRDELFRIKDSHGRSLQQVVEMLAEGDVALGATSFERERAVHKHVGDFTLFWTGVYPEMLRYLRRADMPDHLIDYIAAGRRAYGIASTFNMGRYADEAPVLGALSQRFAEYSAALGRVRRELEWSGSREMHRFRDLLA